ncbi:reductase [Geosmithia morbida]|uniref:Reductase n=1 Tax=Geosmithia morbida TaxID=1094350 RepID=A0A9P5D2K7_9HYPO|nr:reductase [Geosmithia morbida]KAF4121561.1 reductase [Geosmithia morbida]
MAVPSSLNPPSRVLVTGANGFIAQHCVARLLAEGYSVTGTVRSSSKVTPVLATHDHHPELQVIVVEDMTRAESYLDALAAAAAAAAVAGPPEAILHLASPFDFSVSDFEADLMRPAVQGTRALLEAASRMMSVRRVVQTNSFAGIFDASVAPDPSQTYTTQDWSPLTYEDGLAATVAPAAYRASKAAAEKAAWAFVRDRDVHFDLVSLCPGLVFGGFLPGAPLPGRPDELNTSNAAVWSVISAGVDAPIPPTRAPVWVGVHDTAVAHVRALQTPQAGGRRFLVASGVYCNQELADTARRVLAADDKHAGRVPTGKPGDWSEKENLYRIDATDTEEVLQMKWQDLETVLAELMPQLWEVEGV